MKYLFLILLLAASFELSGEKIRDAKKPECGILGDVNRDGIVNSTDALIVLSCESGQDVSQFLPMNCGDVNDDGFVDSNDALIILSYDVGLDVAYPIGELGCSKHVKPCECENGLR